MDARKLEKLRGELAAMRRAPQTARDMEQMAKRLGRKTSKRGKEPTWVSGEFPHLRPLSIPRHGTRKNLSTGVRNNVIAQLEEDVLEWDERLQGGDDGGES